MLLVINKETNEILAKYDAWSCSCFEDATKYIEDNDLVVVDEKLLNNGNMIWFVL